MSLLDIVTGGSSKKATNAQKKALDALAGVNTPTIQQLTLPELEKYAVAMNMSPAQMQAFLQQSNAFNDQDIDQTGTDAQMKALSQLADVAEGGAEGTATSRAQVEQINQDAARNLAGQRGAIDQQAQARGVPPGLLQAALQSQRAGEGQQDAHMAGLNAQSNAYQQALQAMAQGGALGGQLQGQQNTQANTVAQAQNAMQQFNAANQQNASANNAGFQQAANATNTQNANNTANMNTGLSNQRTQYNAQLPQQVFNNNLNKATGQANQFNNLAQTYTGQGQQNAGLIGGLLGAGATLAGGAGGGGAGAAMGSGYQAGPPASANVMQYRPYAQGGVVTPPTDAEEMMKAMAIMRSGKHGNLTPVPGPERSIDIYKSQNGRTRATPAILASNGGLVPGCADGAVVPGDSPMNDTVPAMLSPGEAVIPRSQVQQNPDAVLGLLGAQPGMPNVNPEDIKTLLQAMQMLRGASNGQ